jgi:hypothetical protein
MLCFSNITPFSLYALNMENFVMQTTQFLSSAPEFHVVLITFACNRV